MFPLTGVPPSHETSSSHRPISVTSELDFESQTDEDSRSSQMEDRSMEIMFVVFEGLGIVQ